MPAGKKKKVMVIGGGPSGMEAARVAALRGHEVTLYEKSPETGGLLPLAAMVKELDTDDILNFSSYPGRQVIKEGVTVHTGKEVDDKEIEKFNPDVLIFAAGAVYNNLDIPGINQRSVVSSSQLHKQLRFYMKFLSPKMLQSLTRLWMPIGKRVVIIGGSIHGCELAEFLIKRHREVTIVDSGKILGEGITAEDQLRFFPWLDNKGVTTFTEVIYEEVVDKGLVITTGEGERKTLEADTIILALPFLANAGIAKSLEAKTPEIYNIGSCIEPGLIVNAIADGARTGRII